MRGPVLKILRGPGGDRHLATRASPPLDKRVKKTVNNRNCKSILLKTTVI